MVLKILNDNAVYIYNDIDSTFFRTRAYDGMMYIQFDMSIVHRLYRYIEEQVRVEYDGQRYVVTGINERSKSGVVTINCELDLSGLKSKIITKTFTTASFSSICSEVLNDTGWRIVDADSITKRTTLEIKDLTPIKVLQQCTNKTAFNVCYRYDTVKKIIYCINPESNAQPNGTFFTDELNLTELTFKGSSTALVTRLYIYGKDGLDIASINGGKEYIDNFEYTDEIICDVWRDERYTIAANLKNDGTEKLAGLAVPVRSYECKTIDLARTIPEKYGDLLPYDLYDVVTLVDRNRRTRLNHRIIEMKDYPADHTLDTVTLSNVAEKISGKVTAALAAVSGNINGKLSTLENKIFEVKQNQIQSASGLTQNHDSEEGYTGNLKILSSSDDTVTATLEFKNGILLSVKGENDSGDNQTL